MVNNVFAVINDFRSRAPVDVDGLAKALGIQVSYAHLSPDISGQIEQKKDGSYLISINASDPKTRQRFTLAHELGHFIYHKDRIGDGIDDDRAYRSTDVGKYHNTEIGTKEETQANQFAANLLMPSELISDLKKQGVEACEDLAKRLEVSQHAMSIRLGVSYQS